MRTDTNTGIPIVKSHLEQLLTLLYREQFTLGSFGGSAEYCNVWDAAQEALKRIEVAENEA